MKTHGVSIAHVIGTLACVIQAVFLLPSPAVRHSPVGPSGNLLSPSDGYLAAGAGGNARLAIQYAPAKAEDAFTIGIDARLVPISERQETIESQEIMTVSLEMM